MTLKEAQANYVFSDGQIVSFNLNYVGKPSLSIVMKVREIISKKQIDVFVELKFKDLSEFYLNEGFGANHYSDITLLELMSGGYYLSLDPFENKNEPH